MSWFDKNIRSLTRLPTGMAEEMFMFAVTTGIFAFLAAVLFGSRARRYRQEYPSAESHTEHG
jgi:hypothetical protein